MSIPVVSLLPVQASAQAASAGGDSVGAKDPIFGGLLSALRNAQGPQPAALQPGTANAGPNPAGAQTALAQLLSALSGGHVDLNAAGLGLTAQQQQQLVANLQKLLDGSNDDGAQLLAELMAATQLVANTLPQQLVALTRLLGTTAQGSVSVDALGSNLHLLAQAVQLVASSGGKMTLIQAVQELTPPGDAFAQQLGQALAQHESPTEASDVPAEIDTGPPQGASPGEAATAAASTPAGSNGHETTVTPTGATSPADGAVQEARSQGSPDVADLAKAIEALLEAQPRPNTTAAASGPAQLATAAANPADPTAAVGNPTAANPTAANPAAANPTAANPAAVNPSAATPAQPSQAPSQPSPASQLARMAPEQGTSAGPSQVAAAAPDIAKAGPASTDDHTAPAPKAGVAIAAGAIPAAAAHSGQQDHTGDQAAPQAHADGTPAVVQPSVLPMAATIPTTFSATLDATRAASEAPGRTAAVDQAIVDQIVQNATVALNSGQQEFRIQLKPDFLGALEVRVSVDNGVVDVRMSVESAATRQLIDNNIGQLRQAFGNGEVRVQHVPNFAGSDAAWTFAQGGQQGFWQGQNPYGGSALPEAIPFGGKNDEHGADAAVAVAAAPTSTTSPAQRAPGAIDLEA